MNHHQRAARARLIAQVYVQVHARHVAHIEASREHVEGLLVPDLRSRGHGARFHTDVVAVVAAQFGVSETTVRRAVDQFVTGTGPTIFMLPPH